MLCKCTRLCVAGEYTLVSWSAAGKSRSGIWLTDNGSSFYKDLPRLFEPSYRPTQDDILRWVYRIYGVFQAERGVQSAVENNRNLRDEVLDIGLDVSIMIGARL